MYTHCEYKHICYLQFYKVKTSITKCRVSNSLQIPVDTSSVTDLFIQPYSLSTSSPNPTFTLFALESWQVLDPYKWLHTCSQMLPPNPGLNQEWKNAVSPPWISSGYKKHLQKCSKRCPESTYDLLKAQISLFSQQTPHTPAQILLPHPHRGQLQPKTLLQHPKAAEGLPAIVRNIKWKQLFS